jgi:surfactin synthase thioesterase subunit
VTAIGYQITTEARWFGRSRSQPDSACVLFCLPYSGSGASVFHGWQRVFGARIDVLPVRLPGREDRMAEPADLCPAAIAAAIAGRADRPYAVYGHSIGARLGFEVIRELRRLGAPPPVRFYPAAARPPDVPDPLADCAELADDEFLNALIERIAAPAELRDVPELRELLLPVLRTDFDWVARYRYRAEPPLATAVVGLAGADDPESGPLEMLGWSRQTSALFRLHTLPGGHFFLRGAAGQLASLLATDLLTASQDTAAAAGAGASATAELAAPEQDEVHVWLADLDDLPGACAAWSELSSDEALRAGRVRDAADRRAHIGRCVVLRRILRQYGAAGRPPAGLRCSVSQSGGLILAAVSTDGEIGAHIERIWPAASLSAGGGALDPAERAELLRLPAAQRPAAALRIWTARQAAARLRVTQLPLTDAIGAIAAQPDNWRLRFETLTEVPP